MPDQSLSVPQSATEILGDLTALAQQLGGPDGLDAMTVNAGALGAARIHSIATLQEFLASYGSDILVPHELTAVARAYEHASRGELRELVALDQQLRRVPVLQRFAIPSGQVGRMQLRRLRPLRGARIVPRYLQAVEDGQANGWHTLVFGLVLALYSLPLRQGLVHFAHQTLGGFIESASQRLPVTIAERQNLLLKHTKSIREAVDGVVEPLRP